MSRPPKALAFAWRGHMMRYGEPRLLHKRIMIGWCRRTAAAVAACAVAVAAPSAAEPTGESAGEWRHATLAIGAPELAGGFGRAGVEDVEGTDRDTVIRYRDDTTGSHADIFVFRAGIDSPAIWGDRALDTMLADAKLGTPIAERSLVGYFTPPNGAGTDSAFYAVTALSGSDLASTGLIVFGHDGWLVKLRASSTRLDEGQLGKRMTALLLDLDLGRSGVAYPPARMIEMCSEALEFDAKPQLLGLDFMTLAIFSMASMKERKANPLSVLRAASWCRDPTANTAVSVYRRTDSQREYLAAFGDAGLTAFVGRMSSMGIARPRSSYYAALSDGMSEKIYAPFSKLPRPEVVFAVSTQASPIATIGAGPDNFGEETIVVSNQIASDD